MDTSEADKTNIEFDVHITETIWKLTRSQEKVNHWLSNEHAGSLFLLISKAQSELCKKNS